MQPPPPLSRAGSPARQGLTPPPPPRAMKFATNGRQAAQGLPAFDPTQDMPRPLTKRDEAIQALILAYAARARVEQIKPSDMPPDVAEAIRADAARMIARLGKGAEPNSCDQVSIIGDRNTTGDDENNLFS